MKYTKLLLVLILTVSIFSTVFGNEELWPASDSQGFYCAYIGGNLDAYGGDVEGRVAVGGDYTVHSSYSIGDRLTQSNGGREDAVIDGTFTNLAGNWQVYAGNLVYGDAYSGTMVSFGGHGNHAFQQKGYLDFAAGFSYFRSKSASLANLADNGQVLHDGWGGVTFRGTDPEQNVFTFPLDALQSWGATITIDVPNGSTVIINVPGSSFYMPGGSINNPHRDKTIFNFYEANEVHFRWYSMEATVLAPYADLTLDGGQINGQAIIGGDAVQKNGGEFHNYEFTGHCKKEDPVVVSLMSFTAAPTMNGVEIKWETASESQNAGFHIWRKAASADDYKRITERLIPSLGSPATGASYTFIDSTVQNGEYDYKLEDLSVTGEQTFSEPIRVSVSMVTTVANGNETVMDFKLAGAYPNPFNPSTTISYQLPQAATVYLAVYDALGRLVYELVNEQQQPGVYSVRWNGQTQDELPAPSGVYFLSMRAGDFHSVKKMTLKK